MPEDFHRLQFRLRVLWLAFIVWVVGATLLLPPGGIGMATVPVAAVLLVLLVRTDRQLIQTVCHQCGIKVIPPGHRAGTAVFASPRCCRQCGAAFNKSLQPTR